jgi:hypothetical protein
MCREVCRFESHIPHLTFINSPEEYKQITSATKEDMACKTDSEIYERLESKLSYLRGVEITKSQILEKYGVQSTTIDKWLEKRWIRRLQIRRGQSVESTYDEGDIVVLAGLNKIRLGNSPKLGPFKGGWTPPTRW